MEKKDFIEWATKLQQTYRPSLEVAQKLQNVDLVAIVGPTGAGKSTIISKLDIPYVMSDVSRLKRPGEKDGHTYHFRQDYLDMIKEIKNGEYVQFLVSKNDEFYGTRISSYPDRGPCTMAVVAEVVPQFLHLGFRGIKLIYIMPPSYVEWMRRIGGVRASDLLARISEARQSIQMAKVNTDYHFVLNDDLDMAVEDVRKIIAGEPVGEHRAQLAYDTADIILEHIGDEES